ncbi:MAG: cupin domain-containing protein [Thermomicrobiales bacterium]
MKRPGFRFDGQADGDTSVSFIYVDIEPGVKVRLHRHLYDEIFVILDGEATFRAGGDVVEVEAGDVVISPAGEAHGFENTGTVRLRQVDIHVTDRIEQENLEDE